MTELISSIHPLQWAGVIATVLAAILVGHWEKRSKPPALQKYFARTSYLFLFGLTFFPILGDQGEWKAYVPIAIGMALAWAFFGTMRDWSNSFAARKRTYSNFTLFKRHLVSLRKEHSADHRRRAKERASSLAPHGNDPES